MAAIHDIWRDPELSAAPRYADRRFGCPEEEWDEPHVETASHGIDEVSEVVTEHETR